MWAGSLPATALGRLGTVLDRSTYPVVLTSLIRHLRAPMRPAKPTMEKLLDRSLIGMIILLVMVLLGIQINTG